MMKILTMSFLCVVLNGCKTASESEAIPPAVGLDRILQRQSGKVLATDQVVAERVATDTVNKLFDRRWVELMKDREPTESFVTEEALQAHREEVLATARTNAEGISQAQREEVLVAVRAEVERALQAHREEVLATARTNAEGILQAHREEVLATVRSEVGGAVAVEVNKLFDGKWGVELRSELEGTVTATVTGALEKKWVEFRSELEGTVTATVTGAFDKRWAEMMKDKEPTESFVTEEALQAHREEILATVRSEVGGAVASEVNKLFDGKWGVELRSELEGTVTATVTGAFDKKWAEMMKDKEPTESFVTEEALQSQREEVLVAVRAEVERALQAHREGILAVARATAEETVVAIANKIFEDKLKALQTPPQNEASIPPVTTQTERPEEGFETKNYTITLQDTPPATVTFTILLGGFQQPLRNKGDCVKIKGRDFASLEILITHTMPLFLATLCSFRNTKCFPGNYNINEAEKDGEPGGLFFYSLNPSPPSQSSNCPLLSI